MSSPRLGVSERYLRSWRGPAAVTVAAAGALIFDMFTPQTVSVTAVYVGLVLIGYWLHDKRSALALALLATPLIIIGHWISIPSDAPEWESWMNRGISIGSVWLTAVFVWRIRVLERELQRQIDIANSHARESALLASIVEFGDDAIVSKNLDGIITSWNKGAERMFGYLAEEVIGKSITILIPPERHHEEDVILERIRRGDRLDHYETIRRGKDGNLIDIALTISPLRDANGTVVGASSVPEGRVRVEWARAAGERVVLRWTEAGGPPVTPPTRKGFGTHVMEAMIRGHGGGDVRLDWRAEGLACEIALPT
jgi:PAS domain S-box-containing protein